MDGSRLINSERGARKSLGVYILFRGNGGGELVVANRVY